MKTYVNGYALTELSENTEKKYDYSPSILGFCGEKKVLGSRFRVLLRSIMKAYKN